MNLFFSCVQFTEEKLGTAEKTELDAHFENLLVRADKTKLWTEAILKQTSTLLQPNPSESTFVLHLVQMCLISQSNQSKVSLSPLFL